jgi:hypothetical protein
MAKRPSAQDWENRSRERSRAPREALDGFGQSRIRPNRSTGLDSARQRRRTDMAPCRFESRRHSRWSAIPAPSSRSCNEHEAHSAPIPVPQRLTRRPNRDSCGAKKNRRRRCSSRAPIALYPTKGQSRRFPRGGIACKHIAVDDYSVAFREKSEVHAVVSSPAPRFDLAPNRGAVGHPWPAHWTRKRRTAVHDGFRRVY